jgi:hypothetical protein
MRHAHRLGMSTTATMMYGHVETLEERVEHMRRIRELQDETRGFRAFISWTFQPTATRSAPVRDAAADLVRLPAHAGGLAHLPRQRRPHPVVVGDAGDEGRPGRARVRRRRPRLGDDRGERRLGRGARRIALRRTTSSARSRRWARRPCSATRCTATSGSGTRPSTRGSASLVVGQMLRRIVIAVLFAGVFVPTAGAAGTALAPGITYTRQLVFTPHGPEVVHVMTVPSRAGCTRSIRCSRTTPSSAARR